MAAFRVYSDAMVILNITTANVRPDKLNFDSKLPRIKSSLCEIYYNNDHNFLIPCQGSGPPDPADMRSFCASDERKRYSKSERKSLCALRERKTSCHWITDIEWVQHLAWILWSGVEYVHDCVVVSDENNCKHKEIIWLIGWFCCQEMCVCMWQRCLFL